MAITVETLEQEKYRRGKAFLFLHSELALAAAATDSLVICVGDEPVALSEISTFPLIFISSPSDGSSPLIKETLTFPALLAPLSSTVFPYSVAMDSFIND
mgnify:CR=1 FL=1